MWGLKSDIRSTTDCHIYYSVKETFLFYPIRVREGITYIVPSEEGHMGHIGYASINPIEPTDSEDRTPYSWFPAGLSCRWTTDEPWADECFLALNISKIKAYVSCFMLILYVFCCVKDTKQLLIVFMAPSLSKLYSCICFICFIFFVFSQMKQIYFLTLHNIRFQVWFKIFVVFVYMRDF